MVPVTWIMPGTLRVTLMETSPAMRLPRAILNSHSRGVVHEIISAATAAQLDQLGNCHEGPTTRASHGEARSAEHPGERAR